jgi:hypothetical protein
LPTAVCEDPALSVSGSGAPAGRVDILSRAELVRCPSWTGAFSAGRKDHRYYELIQDTIMPEFDYRYFVVRDADGGVRAIQPFFLLDQDLLAGTSPRILALTAAIRRRWARFMYMRTLMVGCVAGEGHLDGADACAQAGSARLLCSAIRTTARRLNARLIVLKEFPAKYRAPLACFTASGFTRVPSLPMTRLNIDYASFDDYMRRALSRKARQDLRTKLKRAEKAVAIELTVSNDITTAIDDAYRLYLQVYERSRLRFEKLTPDFFCQLGKRMPDRVRFFVWRQGGRAIAFSVCMVEGDAVYAEYLGLDYQVAFDLHLYHYAFRDVVSWAIANGYKWFRSGGLNYDPKLHLRHVLDPLDLYVCHISKVVNALMRRLLPFIEPTRNDATLKKFANYAELWGETAAVAPRSRANPFFRSVMPGLRRGR